MGVDSLVNLVAAKIANMMQACRNIEQMRFLLGITNDFKPVTLEKIVSG